MKTTCLLVTVLALLAHHAAAVDRLLKPCTVISPTSERFFDLTPLRRLPPTESDTPGARKDAEAGSWHARGYDYGANFTLNFCGPVVEQLDAVQDLDKDMWKNVSAFYEQGDRQYAIGLENSTPIFRGRKLILNYTGGSLCPSASNSARAEPVSLDDGENNDNAAKSPTNSPAKRSSELSERRKTTIISLLCESDPLAKTSVSFIAAVDACTYFFEGRSPHACGGVHQEAQTLGPGGVFSVIAMIAVLVYFAGGCVYQRTVMHQRGWRQLPNYSMWAGIGAFFAVCIAFFTPSRLGRKVRRRRNT